MTFDPSAIASKINITDEQRARIAKMTDPREVSAFLTRIGARIPDGVRRELEAAIASGVTAAHSAANAARPAVERMGANAKELAGEAARVARPTADRMAQNARIAAGRATDAVRAQLDSTDLDERAMAAGREAAGRAVGKAKEILNSTDVDERIGGKLGQLFGKK